MVGYSRANLEIFIVLREDVVDPYMKNKGLELPKLVFSHRKDKFLITDASGSEAREIIRITHPPYPKNVKVIDDNYQDLGEQLRGKLNELEEQIARLYGINDMSKKLD